MRFTRNMRRAALQAMYQFDANGTGPTDEIRQSLQGSPGDTHAHDTGFQLATDAWEYRQRADADVAALTPQWPTHRQPLIDRNLLRLAWYEIFIADIPVRITINEAVELAKEFSTEKSPAFINGVLDRLHRQAEHRKTTAAEDAGEHRAQTTSESEPQPPAPVRHDAE